MLQIILAGVQAQVQDAGRFGLQCYGVSVSGALDKYSFSLGNRLVGNDPGTAAIEMLIGGARIAFEQDTVFAITGASVDAHLDGMRVPQWTSVQAKEGEVLNFGNTTGGIRCYLCVAGGIDTEPVLGSRSVDLQRKIGGNALASGEVLPIGKPAQPVKVGWFIPHWFVPHYREQVTVRVIAGPQESEFSRENLHRFYTSEYTIGAESNRQGLRLEGPRITSINDTYDVISDVVPIGSIQVTSSGPIVLLADRQPTGGYLKIGVTASVDIPLIGQLPVQGKVKFKPITLEEAQAELVARKKLVRNLTLMPPLVNDHSVLVEGRKFTVNLHDSSQANGGMFSGDSVTSTDTGAVESDMAFVEDGNYLLRVKDKIFAAVVVEQSASKMKILVDDQTFSVTPLTGQTFPPAPKPNNATGKAQEATYTHAIPSQIRPDSGIVTALMPGRIVSVAVVPGQDVVEGDNLLVVESMKMENVVASPLTGKVREVTIAPGDTVQRGQQLINIKSS